MYEHFLVFTIWRACRIIEWRFNWHSFGNSVARFQSLRTKPAAVLSSMVTRMVVLSLSPNVQPQLLLDRRSVFIQTTSRFLLETCLSSCPTTNWLSSSGVSLKVNFFSVGGFLGKKPSEGVSPIATRTVSVCKNVYCAKMVWPRIAKFYTNLRNGRVNYTAGYDITIYFRSEVIDVPKNGRKWRLRRLR